MLNSYTKTYFGPTNPDDLAHTWVFPFKNTPVSWHWVTWKTWSPCMCWLYRLNPPTYWPVHGLRVESMPCATIAFGCRKWRATQISLQKLQPNILWRTLAAWFIIVFTGQGKSRLVALTVCKQCFGDRRVPPTELERTTLTPKLRVLWGKNAHPPSSAPFYTSLKGYSFCRNSLPNAKKLMNRARNGVKRSEKWNYVWR